MTKNKIEPTKKLKPPPIPTYQQVNSQLNFISINQLSSAYEGQKVVPTISNIRRKYLLQNLINRLKFLIAPNLTPSYIKQNWNQQYKPMKCEDQQGTYRQTLISQINYKYSVWHIISIITALCFVFLFWASSTQLVFLHGFHSQYSSNIFPIQVKLITSLIIVFQLFLKEILIFRQRALLKIQTENSQNINQNQKMEVEVNTQTIKQQFWNNLKDLSNSIFYGSACILYLIMHMIDYGPIRKILQSLVVVIFFTKICSLRYNLEKIYSYVQSNGYKNQYRILTLFFVVIGACHIIALVLYCMTYMYPDSNWISQVNKAAVKDNTWISHYTCSIYFTITTMATVGYGDFTPVQTGQMFIVSFIQLFGSALFGYMINVVGLTVVQINKKNQQFDNQISTINKLQNHYKISRQLTQKFKNQIVKNQSVKKQTPLSQKQQTQFFKMIQNSLKQQFILQTNIKVIKKSIFFLTHFTVNFQNQIALKLIRKIYKKNQRLPLVEHDGQNVERCMLIINSGSVDIQLNPSNNIQSKKFMKNIAPQQGKPTLNVFGYSAFILNKDIDLQATTKDTSAIYLLKRKDVLQCMDKNMLDFQGIAELRQRMLQYKNINHIEAPCMMDIEKHYVPNIFFVNKRKKIIIQKRQSDYERRNRRCRIKLITLKNYQFRTMMCIDIEDSFHKQKQPIYKQNFVDTNSMNNIQATNSLKLIQDPQINQRNKQIIIQSLDQVKNYQNFMKKSNINLLTQKYHEYLKKVRKQRKYKENVQIIMNHKYSEEKVQERNKTYTEGIMKRMQKQQ